MHAKKVLNLAIQAMLAHLLLGFKFFPENVYILL